MEVLRVFLDRTVCALGGDGEAEGESEDEEDENGR